jgi:hypothetical protein
MTSLSRFSVAFRGISKRRHIGGSVPSSVTLNCRRGSGWDIFLLRRLLFGKTAHQGFR